jgi:hypothetical protein
MRVKAAAGALAAAGGGAALYATLLRRPILTWGATAGEAEARLPGDEFLEDADGLATRAVTIDAPVADVWPWVAQMGPRPRGGAYTYDWIENLLGLDMLPMEPGSLLMERKMLRGIKRRAEHLAQERGRSAAAWHG